MAERNMIYDRQKDYLEQIDKMLPYFEETDGHGVGGYMIYATNDMYTIARDQLMLDGYLAEIPHKRGNYVLTGKGRDFIKKGGYTAMFREEERLRTLNKQQLKSVIRTNVLTWINAIVTIVLTIIVVSLQVKADKRESHRQGIEAKKSAEQSAHDSLYESKILHKLEGIVTALEKQKDSARH